MDWSRLGRSVLYALVISFTLGGVLSPPDPFTQLLYASPTFLVALPVLYRYGQQSINPWWRRYLVFAGGLLVFGLAWRALTFAVGRPPSSGVRSAFLLAGVLFGVWPASFGGLERLHGESDPR